MESTLAAPDGLIEELATRFGMPEVLVRPAVTGVTLKGDIYT